MTGLIRANRNLEGVRANANSSQYPAFLEFLQNDTAALLEYCKIHTLLVFLENDTYHDMTPAASSGVRGTLTLSRRTCFRSTYLPALLLLLLGFAVLSFHTVCGATGNQDLVTASIKENDNTRQGSTVGLLADDSVSSVRGMHDVDALASLAHTLGEDSDGSSAMTAHHRRQEEDSTQGEVDDL